VHTTAGTHVAGTIAAFGGNGEGVVGVNRNGELGLFIVRHLDDDGLGFGSDLIYGVQACVENGANVVSMSLGGGPWLQYQEEAFQSYYENNDVLFVAAAGNSGTSAFSYPASYGAVISVAAIDSSKNVWQFSQFNNQVELSGPGVDVLSTLPGNNYGYANGTSMACPHVSGKFSCRQDCHCIAWCYFLIYFRYVAYLQLFLFV